MSVAPLKGLRVLELARILAGPWVGQMLADFGAEVIKVERPGQGDDTRHWGPPYLRDAEGNQTSESAYFLSANRGKRSVAIDFSQPEGAELVRALAVSSDVLVENFKVGGLARYGLDFEQLHALNPRLVYCSITGFGQDGPRAGQAGYDAAIQAMGGLMSITGLPDDVPGGGPQKVGVAVADLLAGLYAANAIQAALIERQRTGLGQHIDISLFDCQVAALANQASNYLVGGQVPGRQGTAHPNIVPYQAFAAADGHLMLAVGNDGQFARLAELLGHAEWAGDERFARNAARVARRELLVEMIGQALATRPVADWLPAFESAGIPAAPINTIETVFEDPQAQHRGLRREFDHPLDPKLPGVANPVRFSGQSATSELAPPLLGADSEAVLTEWLNLPPERIAELRDLGLIGI
jgi:crotonobetainyl-CoA:carnitine CoA-transferase CaiB-like acyl-CoA transferase